MKPTGVQRTQTSSMAKVHPNNSTTTTCPETPPAPSTSSSSSSSTEPCTTLTVWSKSLLFNCRGFTVFDPKGNLLFRVDNYSAADAAETILMDAVGNPLLTIRRKGLGIGERWVVYSGGGAEGAAVVFRMRKKVWMLVKGKVEAQVEGGGGGWGYVVEGCYRRRSCEVRERGKRREEEEDRGVSRKVVAEVRRKEGVGGVRMGDDVFRLVVGPAVDAKVAMAVVVVLEQMFGSSR